MKLKEVYNRFPGYSEIDPSNQLPGGFLVKGSKNIDLTRKKGALAKRRGTEAQIALVTDVVTSYGTGLITVGPGGTLGQTFTTGAGVVNVYEVDVVMSLPPGSVLPSEVTATLWDSVAKTTKIGDLTGRRTATLGLIDFTVTYTAQLPLTVTPATSYYFEITNASDSTIYVNTTTDEYAGVVAYWDGEEVLFQTVVFCSKYLTLGAGAVTPPHTYRRSSGDVILFGHGASCYKLSGTEQTVAKTTAEELTEGTLENTVVAGNGLYLKINDILGVDIVSGAAPSGGWREPVTVGTRIYAAQGASPYRVWIYDTTTNTWDEDSGGASSGTWIYPVAVGTKIFVRQYAAPYKVWIYDTTTNTWDEDSGGTPTGSWEYAVAAGTKIYTRQTVSPYKVWIYDTTTNTWDESSGGTPSVIWDYPTAVGTKIYVRADVSTTKVWIYDTTTNTWDESSGASSYGWIKPVAVGTKIYARTVGPYRLVVYDTTNNTWEDASTVSIIDDWHYPISVGTRILVKQLVSPYRMWSFINSYSSVGTGVYSIDLGTTPLTSILTYNQTAPTNTEVSWQVRGSSDYQNWGDWQNINASGAGVPLTRHAQVKIEMETDVTTTTPSVQDFTITYTTAADTATAIKTGLDGNTLRFVDYDDEVFVAHGGQPFRWDGTNIYNLGITPPTTAPTGAQGGGTGMGAGTYYYKITYIDDCGIGGESNAGPASAAVTIVANKSVDLTAIPISPSPCDTGRKIYRTKAGGSIYYFVALLDDNTATTYTDTTADADMISGILENDNDIPPNASIVHFHKSYMLYVIGDKVYFSKPDLPDNVPSDAYKKFPGNITGIKTYQDACIVGGKDFTVAVIGDIWDADLVSIDKTTKRFISRTTGPINHEAMVECFTSQGDILVFPTEAGLSYITPGLQENSLRSIPLSNRVQPIFDGAVSKENMTGIFHGGLLALALNNFGTDTPIYTNNILMVLDMRGSEWEWSPPWTIAASGFTLMGSNIYFGSPTIGQVYKLNAGTTDAGADINAIAVLKTEYTSLGVSAKKRLKELWLATEGASDTSSLAVTVAVDGISQVITPGDFDLISTKQRIQLAKGYVFNVTVEDTSNKDWIITELILKYKGKEKYGGS